jgi:hypothetical protein
MVMLTSMNDASRKNMMSMSGTISIRACGAPWPAMMFFIGRDGI